MGLLIPRDIQGIVDSNLSVIEQLVCPGRQWETVHPRTHTLTQRHTHRNSEREGVMKGVRGGESFNRTTRTYLIQHFCQVQTKSKNEISFHNIYRRLDKQLTNI